jgi:hypothetical protein
MLIDLLNSRYKVAKSYTKKYTDEVKKCMEDYKCEKDYDGKIHNKHVKTEGRYDLVIPYIYSTHESILSSVFEKGAELVISDKGSQDEAKALAIKAIYEYLRDKLDLDTFYWQSAWWYLLTGFVSSQQLYDIEISGQAPVNGQDGLPLLDELGQPITTPVYAWNDPKTIVDNPHKTYFAPESQFTIDGKKLPYIIREELVEAEELAKKYEIPVGEIEANEELEVGGEYKEDNDDIKRTSCRYYCGKIPAEEGKEIAGYDEKQEYYITYIQNKVLNVSISDKSTTLSRLFASPIDFFGFGFGKTLRSSQKEMSLRRQQQIRYADEYAFPWLTIDASTKVDQRALKDPTKRQPLVYTEKPPQFLVPPTTPQTLTDMDNMARSDAQFISGTLDLSKGAQESNTVKTATGQTLFSQSQDKRINKIRIELGAYFRQVVINLCKLARDNWDDNKVLQVAGDEGEIIDVTITQEILQSIDFDTDIDIQLDTISVNKDTIAERVIALYDKVKDDPLIDRRKVFAKMLKEGFNIKNPESYILEEMDQGTQPIQQPMGNEPIPETPLMSTIGQENAPQPNANPYEQPLAGNY